MEAVCGPAAWHPHSPVPLQLAETAGISELQSTTLGLWHHPTLPEHCLWISPYPLAIQGWRAFQGILLSRWMRKVAEARTCRSKCGQAFHWEFPSFAIGFSYGTCYQEAEFGCRWLTRIVVLTEVDSGSEENAATGASTAKSRENRGQNETALN